MWDFLNIYNHDLSWEKLIIHVFHVILFAISVLILRGAKRARRERNAINKKLDNVEKAIINGGGALNEARPANHPNGKDERSKAE